MTRVSKKIHLDKGRLFTVRGESRYKLCDCKATIELKEELSSLPLLGGNKVERRFLTVLVTFDHKPSRLDSSVELVQFKGEALNVNGEYETIFFTRCLLSSDWDPEMKNECVFEVECPIEQIKTLLTNF